VKTTTKRNFFIFILIYVQHGFFKQTSSPFFRAVIVARQATWHGAAFQAQQSRISGAEDPHRAAP